MALPSSGHTLVACDADTIIAFGGVSDKAAAVEPSRGSIRPKTAPVSRPHTAGGLRPTAALHRFSRTSGQWRQIQAVGPAGQGPPPRTGHAACQVSATSMLVLGGTGSRHEKLSDVWRLDLADQKKKHSAHLVLTLDAITHEAAAEVTAAAEAATGDAAEEGSPLSSPRKREVLQHEKLVASLSGACGGLPAECFRVSSVDSAEPPALAAFAAAAAAEAGDDALAGRVTVRVDVLPLVGVGFNTLDGKDGEELPVAAIAALEAKLRRACPMPEDGAAVVPDAKGGKDAKGKPAAKKGAKDANDGAAEEAAAKAAAARAAAHKRGKPGGGSTRHNRHRRADRQVGRRPSCPLPRRTPPPHSPRPAAGVHRRYEPAAGHRRRGCATASSSSAAVASTARSTTLDHQRGRSRRPRLFR